MLNKFKLNFSVFSSVENNLIEIKNIPFKFSEVLIEFGGKSFDNGLYTIHTFQESLKWTNLLNKYFENFNNKIISFGHDWMGRQFCVPLNANECILIFDPSTFQDLYIEDDLLSFHNNILADDKDNFLVTELFYGTLDHLQISHIASDQCLGFKTPLFLNGKEEPSNYEIGNLEHYWDFEYQLYLQIRHLPENTKISNININPFSK